MKWLIYLLILLNTGLYAWAWQQGRARPAPQPAAVDTSDPGHVRRLLLLSELDSQQLEPLVSPRESEPAQQEVIKAAPPPTPAAPVKVPELKTGPPTLSSSLAEPVVAKNDQGQGQQAENAPVPEPATPEPASTAICYQAGPLQGDEAAADLGDWARQQGAEIEDQVTEQRIPRSYWVYLSIYPDANAARKQMNQLKEQGVRDYARVTSGAMRNAVSLGLYSQVASAERRVAELTKLGYDPKVKTRYSDVRVHQLLLQWPSAAAANESTLRQREPEIRKVDCP